jgi:hypothetical protein
MNCVSVGGGGGDIVDGKARGGEGGGEGTAIFYGKMNTNTNTKQEGEGGRGGVGRGEKMERERKDVHHASTKREEGERGWEVGSGGRGGGGCCENATTKRDNLAPPKLRLSSGRRSAMACCSVKQHGAKGSTEEGYSTNS